MTVPQILLIEGQTHFKSYENPAQRYRPN